MAGLQGGCGARVNERVDVFGVLPFLRRGGRELGYPVILGLSDLGRRKWKKKATGFTQ